MLHSKFAVTQEVSELLWKATCESIKAATTQEDNKNTWTKIVKYKAFTKMVYALNYCEFSLQHLETSVIHLENVWCMPCG